MQIKKYILYIVIFVAILTSIDFAINPLNAKYTIIDQDQNEYGSVWVYSLGPNRCLTFEPPSRNVVRSCKSYNNPEQFVFKFQQFFLIPFLLNSNIDNILILGLGGASVINALDIIRPKTHKDIVEINPVIVKLASEYFDFSENNYSKLFIEDAYKFVSSANHKKYDLIIIDLFDEVSVPEQFITDKFFKNVKRHLSKKGIVALNSFRRTDSGNMISQLFNRNFKNHFRVKAEGNNVDIGYNESFLYDDIVNNNKLLMDDFKKVGVNSQELLHLIPDINNK